MSVKKPYTIKHFQTADELWDALSPTKKLEASSPESMIYRGQANAKWGLIPSALREGFTLYFNQELNLSSDMKVFDEILSLRQFVEYCDRVGIKIPDESSYLRRELLNLDTVDKYMLNPSLWPHPDILNVMAFAQHHGVPTRLLDWTRNPYIAFYFAVSSALCSKKKWKANDKIAVWAMNLHKLSLHKDIKIHTSPGSVSPHLAAQYGLFTVHKHNGERGGKFEAIGLESQFVEFHENGIFKLTLPVYESVRALSLCINAGFSAVDIYPTPDGAGKALIDELNANRIRRLYNIESIKVRI